MSSTRFEARGLGGFWMVVTVPKSIGIGSCRFVGTAVGIIGFASSGLGADLVPKSAIIGRILPGPF